MHKFGISWQPICIAVKQNLSEMGPLSLQDSHQNEPHKKRELGHNPRFWCTNTKVQCIWEVIQTKAIENDHKYVNIKEAKLYIHIIDRPIHKNLSHNVSCFRYFR